MDEITVNTGITEPATKALQKKLSETVVASV